MENDGCTAIDAKKYPDHEFAGIGIFSKYEKDNLKNSLTHLKENSRFPLETHLIESQLLLYKDLSQLDGYVEFYPARIIKRRPKTIKNYSVQDGVQLVENLISTLRTMKK